MTFKVRFWSVLLFHGMGVHGKVPKGMTWFESKALLITGGIIKRTSDLEQTRSKTKERGNKVRLCSFNGMGVQNW